jgi:hypothetical protein
MLAEQKYFRLGKEKAALIGVTWRDKPLEEFQEHALTEYFVI